MKKIAINITNSLNERIFPRDFSKDSLWSFFTLFSGRDILQSEENPDENSLKPLIYDERNLILHFRGEKSLMYYPIDDELNTNVCVIICNFENNIIKDNLEEKLDIYSSFANFLDYFYEVNAAPLIELFNLNQIRLWFFLEKKIHFLKAKKITETTAMFFQRNYYKINFKPLLFTEKNYMDWKEMPIPLPLGIIPKTNCIRRLFIDHLTSKFYQDQLGVLDKIIPCSVNRINEIIQDKCYHNHYSRKKLNINKTQYNKTNTENNANNKIDCLISDIREKCKVINFILTKTDRGINLNENEKKILYYTISFFDENKEFLRYTLSKCPDFKPKTFERQIENLYPRPMSCPKIRELIPSVVNALDCNCIFNQQDIEIGRYPSPLLYVNSLLVPTMDERFTSKYSSPKEIAKEYMFISQEIEALQGKKTIILEELRDSMQINNKKKIKLDNLSFILDDENNIKTEEK